MTPSARSDRYEPLPGLLQIPGYLVRKIPPHRRRPAAYAAALLVLGVAVALAFSIPAITDSKDQRAAADQRAERERQAQRTAELQAQLRPTTGEGPAARGLAGAAALDARQALAADLEAAVHDDALARMQAGELTQSVNRVECERYPRAVGGNDPATNLALKTARYSCLAITADAPRVETNAASSIGYPYRALVDFEAGTYGFCMVSGRPGEGGIKREQPLRVPASCGG